MNLKVTENGLICWLFALLMVVLALEAEAQPFYIPDVTNTNVTQIMETYLLGCIRGGPHEQIEAESGPHMLRRRF